MAAYADPKSRMAFSNRAKGDKEFFDQLSAALMSYLREQQSQDIAKDSTAAKVLSTVLALHHYT